MKEKDLSLSFVEKVERKVLRTQETPSIGDIIEDNVLNVCDLKRTMITDKDILAVFFRINEVNNSHDLDYFHFPEDMFQDIYSDLVPMLTWRRLDDKTMNYETASSYAKNKVRIFYLESVFKQRGIIPNNVSISMSGYEWNPDYYEFKNYYDSREWAEYDKFRETGGGLYDLGTQDLELLKPNLSNNFKELEDLRSLVINALRSRTVMILELAGAAYMIKDIDSRESIYKSDVEAVISMLNSVNKKLEDKELLTWLSEGNNDYTLYVKKSRKLRKNPNSEYIRRQTELAYIECYHNVLASIYGFEIFQMEYYYSVINQAKKYKCFSKNTVEDARNMIKYTDYIKEEFYKYEGRSLTNRIFAPSKSEDSTVSYKENLDWVNEEKDDNIVWNVDIVEYEENSENTEKVLS